MPASLKDIQETFQIAMEIGIRICDRISDSRLRGQVDDHIELLSREQPVKRLLVAYITFHEAERRPAFAGPDLPLRIRSDKTILLKPSEFQTYVIIVVDIVKTNDLVSPAGKLGRQVGSDETSRSCYQNLHPQAISDCQSKPLH